MIRWFTPALAHYVNQIKRCFLSGIYVVHSTFINYRYACHRSLLLPPMFISYENGTLVASTTLQCYRSLGTGTKLFLSSQDDLSPPLINMLLSLLPCLPSSLMKNISKSTFLIASPFTLMTYMDLTTVVHISVPGKLTLF